MNTILSRLKTCATACALVAGAGVFLAGCATEITAPPSVSEVLMDSAFKPPTVRIDPSEALAFSPAMQRFADNEMAGPIRSKGARDGLIEALYSRSRLQLDYDSETTRSAAEAFEARRGNCMSLVLMTAAFAHHFNLPFQFNSVFLEESWSRASGLYFISSHVNISLAKPLATSPQTFSFGGPELLTIDFLPPEQVRGQRSRVVDERTIVAMYLNNRAAEALTVGQIDNAYAWARAAVLADPRWLSAYNTLAVLYRRKGLMDKAESTLRQVLAREPLNSQALSNLILVLSDVGRQAEAQVFADQLAKIQPVPPYQLFDQGVAAMKVGEYDLARRLFRQEIARAAYVPEFHFWLALASYGLGDLSGARGEIVKALENATTVKDRAIYGAKLAWLNEQRELRDPRDRVDTRERRR